jgi:hypothetical protein
MIASRQITAKPGKVWADLEKEGALVVTRDGRPFSIILPTSDETLIEDIQELVFSRARRAVTEIRRKAQESGAARMSPKEIDAEVVALRKARKRRGTRA